MAENGKIKILPVGDMAVAAKLGTDISPETNRKVRQLMFCLEQQHLPGIIEMVPAYNELMIYYNPLEIELEPLVDSIHEAENSVKDLPITPARRIHVPVCYGGEFGSDLPEVARQNQLTEQQVIDIYTGTDYLIYMLGFAPGFCYLGGMDERIATPRKESPRIRIRAGSVGIAGTQTGIYPLESPGGWQIIGCTPLRLFDPGNNKPILFRAGDTLCFYPIGHEAFEKIASEVAERIYKPLIENL